jgi:hypothetical protein
MPDERGGMIIGGVEAEVRALRQDVTDLKVSVGRLETGFDQVDKRISETNAVVGDTRKEVRQLLYVVLGTWVTLMLTVITMSMTILSRLK